MDVYAVALFLMAVGGFLAEFTNGDKKAHYKIYLCVVAILWTFLATFRATHVGTDVIGYLHALHGYPNDHFEPGYYYFNEFLSSIGCSDSMFFLIVAVIIYLPILRTIYRYSEIPWISVMIFFSLQFFGLTFSAIRQMIAVAVIVYGIKYILECKMWRWMICCGLASMFHYSSLCMFPVYWISKIGVSKKVWFGFLLTEILVFFGADFFVSNLGVYLPRYSYYLPVNENTGGIGDVFRLGCLNFLVFLRVKRFCSNCTSIGDLSVICLMLSCLVLIVSFSTENIVKRLNIYYYFFLVFIIPSLIKRKDNTNEILPQGLLYVIMAFYFYYYVSSSALQLYPYEFSF